MQRQKVILVMKKYVIEPLGVMHLAGIANELNWDVEVFLYENKDGKFDFDPLYEKIKNNKPDLVGFSVWTGAHLQSFAAADYIRKELNVRVVIGGPHATYFTKECKEHADMVAKGEGFRIFAHILGTPLGTGIEEQSPGIFFDTTPKIEHFPLPHRKIVYQHYPE